MVKWIGKFSLLLKRLRDAWMDMPPVYTMSQERRETQYFGDITQLNEERQRRNVTALDPNAQETRDHWDATQVANHDSSFPFSDNVATLMFIVASDLSEVQRETYKFSFSPRNECPCLYPKTMFMDLFCTPKSSMDNPSIRESGHGGSTSIAVIVEDYVEDEQGQWVTDEVTYIDDERSCCWTWDDNEYVWQSRQFRDHQLKRGKGKGEGKGKGGFKGTGRAFLWKRTNTGSCMAVRRRLCLVVQREKEARRVFRKVKNASLKMGFRTHQPEKSAGSDFNPHKGRGKDQKGKGKEGAYPQSGFSASEAPSEERNSPSWESDDRYSNFTDDLCLTTERCGTGHTACMATVPLDLANHPTHNVLNLPETCVVLWHYNIVLLLQQVLLCLQTLRWRLVGKSCIIHFPTKTSMFYQGWCAWER